MGQNDNPCFFYNIEGYYDGLLAVYQQMVDQEFLNQEDFARIKAVKSPEELLESIENSKSVR